MLEKRLPTRCQWRRKIDSAQTISGLLTPTEGTITFDGDEIGGTNPATLVDMGVIQVPEGRRVFLG